MSDQMSHFYALHGPPCPEEDCAGELVERRDPGLKTHRPPVQPESLPPIPNPCRPTAG